MAITSHKQTLVELNIFLIHVVDRLWFEVNIFFPPDKILAPLRSNAYIIEILFMFCLFL